MNESSGTYSWRLARDMNTPTTTLSARTLPPRKVSTIRSVDAGGTV